MDKKELRAQIRKLKRAMTEEQIVEASARLGELFIETPEYKAAKTIYGYLPYNQEVRTVPMLEQALRDGKKVAVPKCYGDEMRFIYMDDLSKVAPGYADIPEPIADDPVMAFTEKGDRMGYGGGFYDKFLAAEPEHPTVALCYAFQMVESLPTEEYDIPVDRVVWA